MLDHAVTISRTIEALPDLEQASERLRNEPEDVLARAFPAEDRGRKRAIVGAGGQLDRGLTDADAALRERALEEGSNAIRKILDHGHDAPLTAAEALGAEAIILMTGRPAILIQDGRFFPPPQEWAVLEDHRDAIDQLLPSIGRIEVSDHPQFEWIGTGFLVAEDVVMTNRHVAKEFCRQGQTGGWAFDPGISARIDYVEELGAPVPAEFALEDVIGVHDQFDLALFRVARTGAPGRQPPTALDIAAAAPDQLASRQLFVVGYPAWDGRRNDPSVMQRIFSNIFDVKRLQPGTLLEYLQSESLVTHDCSTLGGNSGSCVIDLATRQVLGLHFSGRYGEANRAVALWDLREDPLLARAGVNFA